MSYSFRFPYSIFLYQAPLRSGGQPHWYARLAVTEAVLGLFIEISFIATFTQRFFGK